MSGIFDEDIFDLNGDGEVDFFERALTYDILMEDDEEEEVSDGYDDFDDE